MTDGLFYAVRRSKGTLSDIGSSKRLPFGAFLFLPHLALRQKELKQLRPGWLNKRISERVLVSAPSFGRIEGESLVHYLPPATEPTALTKRPAAGKWIFLQGNSDKKDRGRKG